MKLKEVSTPPKFTLRLSLQETVDLYRMALWAKENGYENAEQFADALNEFAANSNNYIGYGVK
jgi:hypothetical protein